MWRKINCTNPNPVALLLGGLVRYIIYICQIINMRVKNAIIGITRFGQSLKIMLPNSAQIAGKN